MEIKTFEELFDHSTEDFDRLVNDFIKGKKVVQITTNITDVGDYLLIRSLTVLYEEE